MENYKKKRAGNQNHVIIDIISVLKGWDLLHKHAVEEETLKIG